MNTSSLRKAITAIIKQNTWGNPFFKILKENSFKKPTTTWSILIKMQLLQFLVISQALSYVHGIIFKVA